jgi:hypothetical protein
MLRPLLPFGDFINLALLTIAGGGFFAATALVLRVGATEDLIAMTPLGRLLPVRHRPA